MENRIFFILIPITIFFTTNIYGQVTTPNGDSIMSKTIIGNNVYLRCLNGRNEYVPTPIMGLEHLDKVLNRYLNTSCRNTPVNTQYITGFRIMLTKAGIVNKILINRDEDICIIRKVNDLAGSIVFDIGSWKPLVTKNGDVVSTVIDFTFIHSKKHVKYSITLFAVDYCQNKEIKRGIIKKNRLTKYIRP
jgi:hypothetical protein